jgi:2-polyprenyl-6-methoxyphenol hydroxylase-like FAD-dependent oxidoreductase
LFNFKITMKTHVLVSGAGPVGLDGSALKLSLSGFKVTVFETASELNSDLRASTFHPPTLDMLEQFGLAQELISQGSLHATPSNVIAKRVWWLSLIWSS